jgi:hypothetical protein
LIPTLTLLSLKKKNCFQLPEDINRRMEEKVFLFAGSEGNKAVTHHSFSIPIHRDLFSPENENPIDSNGFSMDPT